MPKTNDYRMLLGNTIREQRARVGFTQEKLAERADLHPNYLGRVERGEEHISFEGRARHFASMSGQR